MIKPITSFLLAGVYFLFSPGNVAITSFQSNYQDTTNFIFQIRTINAFDPEKLISLDEIIYVDSVNNEKDTEPIKIVSVNFGNPADQNALISYFNNKYSDSFGNKIELLAFNYSDFVIPPGLEGKSLVKKIRENTAKFDSIQSDAVIGMASGHHRADSKIVHGLYSQENPDSINAAINFEELTRNENMKVFFLTACTTVDNGSNFTMSLLNTYPNAVLLGYKQRSAAGNANGWIVEKFFSKTDSIDILCASKLELAMKWIEAGNEVYKSMHQNTRQLSASWKENDVIYELNSKMDTSMVNSNADLVRY